MSDSNIEWSSELPTETGAYLFVGDMTSYSLGYYEYSMPKLFIVHNINKKKCIEAKEMIVTESFFGIHSIHLCPKSAFHCADGLWYQLEYPYFNSFAAWTSEAPVKAGTYFFQGSVFNNENVGRGVFEFFNCNGTLQTIGPNLDRRACVSDFDGLWCEVVPPPLPEKTAVNYDDIPF